MRGLVESMIQGYGCLRQRRSLGSPNIWGGHLGLIVEYNRMKQITFVRSLNLQYKAFKILGTRNILSTTEK